jgi:hypothetical protein
MPEDVEATVRDLIAESRKFADEEGQHIISFDLGPEEAGDHVLLVVCVGKEARNSMARLLNTFMEFGGEKE